MADRVREVESTINRVGFVCKVEDVNAVEAWVGSFISCSMPARDVRIAVCAAPPPLDGAVG